LKTKTARFVIWSCEHAPFTHKPAIEAMLEAARKFKATHAVCLGDRFESAAASVHPNEVQHDLQDEYEAAALTSVSVRRALPKAELIWMLGNHDDNIQRQDPRRVPKELRSLLHWNKSEWGHEFKRWRQIPYTKSPDGVYQWGPLRCYHGFDCGANSDELEALEMSWATRSPHNTLWVRGHTHTPIPVTQALRTRRIPLPLHYANVGHMGPARPDWASRLNTSRWGRGFLLAEVGSDGWTAQLHNA